MILALSLLSVAQAGPTSGFRGTFCGGNSSHCPIVQIGMAYVNNRFGVRVGGSPLPVPLGFNFGLQYYFSEAEQDKRYFVGTSAGGSISGFYDFAAIGVHGGVDFHLSEDRKTIFTPRLGVDYVSSSGLITTRETSFRPTVSVEIARAF